MDRMLVGFFSWDDGQRSRLAEKSLHNVTSKLKGEPDIDIVVLDNGTRSVTQRYVSTVDAEKVYLPTNIHDIGLHYVLYKMAADRGYGYCVPVENDFFFYKPWKLRDCGEFMASRPNIGACRIQQFEYAKKEAYDKSRPRGRHKGQAQRMFNCITGEKLVWQGPFRVGRSAFHITNWHWVNSPIVVKTSVYQQLFARMRRLEHWPVWQVGEVLMMRCYQYLGLLMGVVEGGCCKHHHREKGMVESTYRANPLRDVTVPQSTVVEIGCQWQAFLER